MGSGGGPGCTWSRGVRNVAGAGACPLETGWQSDPVSRAEHTTLRVPIVSLLIRSSVVESGAELWSQTPGAQQPQTRRTSAKHGPRVLPHSNTLSKRLHTGLVNAKIPILRVSTEEPTKSQLNIPLYCWFANSINSIVGR